MMNGLMVTEDDGSKPIKENGGLVKGMTMKARVCME